MNTSTGALEIVEKSIKNQELHEETKEFVNECIRVFGKIWLSPRTPTFIYEWNFKKSLYENEIFSKSDIAEAVKSFEEIKGKRLFSGPHGEYVNPKNKSVIRIEGEYPSGE